MSKNQLAASKRSKDGPAHLPDLASLPSLNYCILFPLSNIKKTQIIIKQDNTVKPAGMAF